MQHTRSLLKLTSKLLSQPKISTHLPKTTPYLLPSISHFPKFSTTTIPFDNLSALDKITKYTNDFKLWSATGYQQSISQKSDIQDFIHELIPNLNNFKNLDDLSKALNFLLESFSKDAQGLPQFALNLSQNPNILDFSAKDINKIVALLIEKRPENTDLFLNHLASLLKEQGKYLEANKFIELLSVLSYSLSPLKYKQAHGKSKKVTEIANEHKEHFAKVLGTLNSSNLVRLYEFYFDQQQDQGWKKVIPEIEKRFVRNYPGLKIEYVTSLAHMLAYLKRDIEKLWDRLADEVVIRIHEYPPGYLSSLLNSFQQMGKGETIFYEEINQKLSFSTENTNYTDIPEILFTFANNCSQKEEAFQAYIPKVIENLDRYTIEDVVKIFYSYGGTKNLEEKLNRILTKKLVEEFERIPLQEYNHILDAIACIRDYKNELLTKMIPKLTKIYGNPENFPELEPNLSVCVLNLDTEGDYSLPEELFEGLCEYFMYKLDHLELRDKEYVNILGSLLCQRNDQKKIENKKLITDYLEKVNAFYEKERDNFDEQERGEYNMILTFFKKLAHYL